MSKQQKVIVVVENNLQSLIHLYCAKVRVGAENVLALVLTDAEEKYNPSMVAYCEKEGIKTYHIPVNEIYNKVLSLTSCFDVEELLELSPKVEKRVVTDFTLDPRFPPMEFPKECKQKINRSIKNMLVQAIGDALEVKIVGESFFNPLADKSEETLKDLVKFIGIEKEAKELKLM